MVTNMQCPLPIDWLEYVEGAKGAELIAHLKVCVPCRLLVEDLQRESRVPLDPKHLASQEWPHWKTSKPARPQFGEIWWTVAVRGKEELPFERLLIVVISDVWKERGHAWCDVVPLTSDIENATSLDMVLSRHDNDVHVSWRALLRYQIVAETVDLEVRIGSLTDDCKAVVRQALNAQAPCERFGSQIESSLDLRLRAVESVGNLAKGLAQKYAQTLEEDESPRKIKSFLSFEMLPSWKSLSAQRELSLAAASRGRDEVAHWSVHIPNRGFIEGRIDHRYPHKDELFFVVDKVLEENIGLKATAWILAWFTGSTSPTSSEPFEPSTEKEVLLGRDLGVFPNEIKRLELRVTDES